MRPVKCSGGQVEKAMRPPVLSTRSISRTDKGRTRREDVAELAEYDIERGVRIGQRLGVAFGEVDIDGGDAGIVASALEQHGRQIEPRNLGAAARGRDRDDAGAAGDVEHSLPGRHLRELHQLGRRDGRDDLDRQRTTPRLRAGPL